MWRNVLFVLCLGTLLNSVSSLNKVEISSSLTLYYQMTVS